MASPSEAGTTGGGPAPAAATSTPQSDNAVPPPPPPPAAPNATATRRVDADEPTYEIKRLRFFGRPDVPIFLQNVNGPCPLLAIANVLSLRGRLPDEALPPGDANSGGSGAVVRQSRLVAAVADRLVAACDELTASRTRGGGNGNGNPTTSSSFSASSPASDENAAAVLGDAIEALGALATGLDVNVRFASPPAFEPTRETSVFDLLGVPLLHGWVPDPRGEAEAHALLVGGNGVKAAHPSYNQAVELLLTDQP